MEDLLIIKANDKVWAGNERVAIIDSALTAYMTSRRKLKIDDRDFGMLGSAKRTRINDTDETLEKSSESESDSDSDVMPLSESDES